MGGLAQAFADNVPVLYLPGGPAINQHSVRPNFSPARESVSVYSEVLWKADMTASVMRRAFHHLRNGRPGPVIVEIPADVGTQEVPDSAMNYLPPRRMLQAPAASDVKDAVRLLLNAKKPVIWSGMGTLMAEASAELREFAELTEVPVYCTMPGKSGFDERHPLALGSGSSSPPAGLPVAARVGPPPGPGLQPDAHRLWAAYPRWENHDSQYGEPGGHRQGLQY